MAPKKTGSAPKNPKAPKSPKVPKQGATSVPPTPPKPPVPPRVGAEKSNVSVDNTPPEKVNPLETHEERLNKAFDNAEIVKTGKIMPKLKPYGDSQSISVLTPPTPQNSQSLQELAKKPMPSKTKIVLKPGMWWKVGDAQWRRVHGQ